MKDGHFLVGPGVICDVDALVNTRLLARGHPFDKVPSIGRRRCSLCDRAQELRRYERRYGRKPKPNSRTKSRISS